MQPLCNLQPGSVLATATTNRMQQSKAGLFFMIIATKKEIWYSQIYQAVIFLRMTRRLPTPSI